MGRTGMLVLCAVVPLSGIVLAVKYGPGDAPSGPVPTAAASGNPEPGASVAAAPSSAVPAPIMVPELRSLRVGVDDDADLRAKLDEVLDVDFEDVPLETGLERLARAGGVRIELDAAALAEIGVPRNEPFSFHGRGRPWGDELRERLCPLVLDWFDDAGRVLVTTEPAAATRYVVHWYDVRPIREALERQTGTTAWPQVRQYGTTGRDRPGARGRAAVDVQEPEAVPAPYDRIVDYVTSNTRVFLPDPNPQAFLGREELSMSHPPGMWQEFDGTGGTARVSGDLLVVRQTHAVHRQIDVLLSSLRFVLEGKLRHGSMPVEPLSRAERLAAQTWHVDLERPISVDFRDVPWDQALAAIGKELGVPVHLETRGLDDGMTRREPRVSLALSDTPARSVLHAVIDPLELELLEERGRLVVTNWEGWFRAHQELDSRLYDVRDVTDRLAGDDVVELVFNETSGPYWEIDGTGGAVSMPMPGVLMVRQSLPIHEEVRALLAGLRRALTGHAPRVPAPPRTEDPEELFWRLYPPRGHAFGKDGVPALSDFRRQVQKEVDPESWEANGGYARFRGVPDGGQEVIAVLQTFAGHLRIDRLLDRTIYDSSTPRKRPWDDE